VTRIRPRSSMLSFSRMGGMFRLAKEGTPKAMIRNTMATDPRCE